MSGITLAKDLVDGFIREAEADVPSVRMIKAEIVGEQVVLTAVVPPSGSEEDDFDAITNYLIPKTPAFILFRRGPCPLTKGSRWIFVYFMPDDAKVQRKMLYGSSLEATTRSLGVDYFDQHFMGHSREDISWRAFCGVATAATEQPLTALERLSLETTLGEQMVKQESGVSTPTGSSIALPMTDAAREQIEAFRLSPSVTCVKFKISVDDEKIDLLSSGSETADSLGQPENMPVYCIFKFQAAGEDRQRVVFAYACPDTSKVKQKLIYSATRGNALQCVTESGIVVDMKMEVGSLDDISTASMQDMIQPVKDERHASPAALSRPARPGRRSAGRTPT